MALARPISPWLEMGAYEALWTERGAWFKSIAEKFSRSPGSIPSDFVQDHAVAYECSRRALSLILRGGVDSFGIRIHGDGQYPDRLQNAYHPSEVLYYRGFWDLVETPSVAVVGTRHPSESGLKRAAKLAKALASDGYTIVSGLASGIDAAAHTAAIECNASTIAVIGTPISEYYPKENRALQDFIAKNHLLISQVPVCRYADQNYRLNSRFFPERNVTMSALTQATVIVEASDTSGTLIQARAALKQGRKLFILDSCFDVPALKWPHSYLSRGAVRVRDYDDIRQHLGNLPGDTRTAAED